MLRKALAVIEFSESDVEVRTSVKLAKQNPAWYWLMEFFFHRFRLELQDLFSIIASVLHLGNIRFEADGRGYACTSGRKETHWVSKVRLKQV